MTKILRGVSLLTAALFLPACDALAPKDPVDCSGAASTYLAMCPTYSTESSVEQTYCENSFDDTSSECYAWASTWADCVATATTCDEMTACQSEAYDAGKCSAI